MARRRLAVDWQACKAHGVCAELLPEIVQLDEWGYPLVAPGPVPPELRGYAQRAVKACPALALRLVAAEGSSGSGVRPALPAPAPAQAPPPLNGSEGARRRARRSS